MIVNIRGTSGAGKSTLVKRVTACYELEEQRFIKKRKQPYFSIWHGDELTVSLLVPGHYATACGGCDTVKTVDEVYKLVGQGAAEGVHVLYEGIMVMDDVNRAVAMHTKVQGKFLVIGLTTPVDLCLTRVQERRVARGDERPLNPKNTVQRARRCERGLERLAEAGVSVERLDGDAAFNRICGLFGVGP